RMGVPVLDIRDGEGASEGSGCAGFRPRPKLPTTRHGSMAFAGHLLTACIYRRISTDGRITPIAAVRIAGRLFAPRRLAPRLDATSRGEESGRHEDVFRTTP